MTNKVFDAMKTLVTNDIPLSKEQRVILFDMVDKNVSLGSKKAAAVVSEDRIIDEIHIYVNKYLLENNKIMAGSLQDFYERTKEIEEI